MVIALTFGAYVIRENIYTSNSRYIGTTKPADIKTSDASESKSADPAANQPLSKIDAPIALPQTPAQSSHIERKILQLFSEKKYTESLNYSESMLKAKSTPLSTKIWIKDQLPTINLAIGFEYLKESKCDDAISYFRKALDGSRSTDAIKGLVYCYNEIGRFDLAQNYLDIAVEKNTFDLEMLKLHREVMESVQNLSESVEYFEAALEYFNNSNNTEKSAIVEKELNSIKKKIQEERKQTSFMSNNFFIKFRSSLDEQKAITILDFLEESLSFFTQNYQFNLPSTPIEVVLYPSTAFLDSNGSAPVWAEGLYDGRLRIPLKSSGSIALTNNLKSVLKHELVHALLADLKKRRKLGTWLEEGLAQYLSCEKNCAPLRGGGATSVFLSIDELESAFTRLDKKNASRAYNQSLYLIYTLISEYDRNAASGIIEAISRSSDISSDRIIEMATGKSFKTVYRAARSNWLAGNLLRVN